MAWATKTGINLRASIGFVTDPAGTVGLPSDPSQASDNPAYTPGSHSNSPISVNGNSFNIGWSANNLDGARDRSAGVADKRLAGRQGPLSGTLTLKIQAGTATGKYKIWLGVCDIGNGTSAGASITISDTNGTLATVTGAAALTSNQVLGADGTIYTNATAWDATADGTGNSITVTTTDSTNGNGGPFFSFLCNNTSSPIAHVSIQFLQPTIIQQPGSVVINSGDNAYLQVVANSSGGALSYQWQDNRSGSFANVIDGTGGTAQSYVTASLSTGDTGRQYQCIVTDSSASVTSSAAAITVLATYNTTIADFDPDLTIRSWYG